MNHQIENHVDIETARGKHAQPVDFEEERNRGRAFERLDGGVEALQVPHLKNAAVTFANSASRSPSAEVCAIGFSMSTSTPEIE